MEPLLYLASLSPRRRELLAQIGVPHRQLVVEIDETPRPEESAEGYVARLALEKAAAGWAEVGDQTHLPVLAADTAVVVDGEILGKPRDREDARRMLRLLSGREHQVMTGVALAGAVTRTALSVSRVGFRTITDAEAAAYWESGEPLDKAGGYAVQGRGALFISHLEGSYSGVMGLPLFETGELLREAGIPVIAGWPQPHPE